MHYLFGELNFILLIIGSISIGVLGLLVLFSDTKSVTNRTFFLFTLVGISYAVVNYFSYQIRDPGLVLWLLRFVLFSAVWYSFLLLHLFKVFPKSNYSFSRIYKYFLIPLVVITSVVALSPFTFTTIESLPSVGEVANPDRGWGIGFFAIVTISLVVAGIYTLTRKTRQATGFEKKQLRYLLAGALITYSLYIIFNLISPVFFNNLTFIPFAPLFLVPFVVLTSYAIIRHQLLDIKVIATEVVTFIMWIFVLTRALLSDVPTEQILNAILLVFLILFGVILIKSVRNEVRQRELLAVANKKLERLNMEKSEFLSIATHQLKTPISEIRNAVSMLLEGSFGEINEKARGILGRVFDSAQRQNVILDDFLNVSRIEQGRMKYDFGIVDMRKLVNEVTESMRHVATSAGLTLASEIKPEGDIHVTADYGKIRQIITNLIDNAIKYSKQGEVKIVLDSDKKAKKVKISVVDSGIGMSKETISKLFKRFSRAKDVGKVQVGGSGLGLYIAKEMVEAHGGRIWAESEGDGKGSVFHVELPFTPPNTNPMQERKYSDGQEEKAPTTSK